MEEVNRSSIKQVAKAELNGNIGSYIIVVIVQALVSMLPLFGQICQPVFTYGFIKCIKSIREGGSFDLDEYISGFGPNFANIMITGWTKIAYVFLGSLLCVLPGLYFQLIYFWTDYIMVEDPTRSTSEVLELSKALAKDRIVDILIYNFSWIGWLFLVSFTCGLGMLYVVPYIQLATLGMYEAYKAFTIIE